MKNGLFFPRQIDGEDASFTGEVAYPDLSAAVLDPVPTDRQSKAEPGSIGAMLLEHAKKVLALPRWEPTALILDFDLYAIDARKSS